MIYIITADRSRFALNPIYRMGTREMLLSWIDERTIIPIDSETRGFDPFTKSMMSLQIGDKQDQFVIDCESMPNILWLKAALERKTLLGHNLKFDLRFLYKAGIVPMKVWDTFIAEKILNNGIVTLRNSLAAVALRYLNVTLDKGARKDITRKVLSPNVISYAAEDVVHLFDIRRAQIARLEDLGLTEVIKLENAYTPALAYIEHCGFKLDVEKWQAKMEEDQARVKSLREQLDEWVITNGHDKFISKQTDLFADSTIAINWSSPLQMVPFFEHLGIDCTVVVKGVTKKSVEEGVLQKYRKDHPIVELYLDFKKAEKITTTYGQNFIDQINKVTGRLHTNFNQLMDTGRTSSGGKHDKVNLINFQNIPKDPKTRACFVSEPGQTLIVADYIGQEQVILANMSMDPNLLEFYDKGLGDMHAFVASKMVPELEGLPLSVIKEKYAEKRQEAKSAGFAISYGGNGVTIAENLNIPRENGEKIYNAYFIAFPGLRQYFDKAKQQGLQDGYILISSLTNRKCFLPNHEAWMALENMMDKTYWAKYREEKSRESATFKEMRRDVKDYFYYKGDMERTALNYPIQGCAAEILKIATIYFFKWIVENNYFDVVKICNTIHDELVPECPEELAPTVRDVVKEFMEKAGRFYCKRVLLKADPQITNFWKK